MKNSKYYVITPNNITIYSDGLKKILNITKGIKFYTKKELEQLKERYKNEKEDKKD